MSALPKKVLSGNGVGRDLYVLEAVTAEDVSRSLVLPSARFMCLVAWDSQSATVDEISQVARCLLDAGAVYICAWGPGCERVHDICDEEQVGPFRDSEQNAMTTWHADEPLADALWFVLNAAIPEDRWIAECQATVGISIGSQEWAGEIRAAFSAGFATGGSGQD